MRRSIVVVAILAAGCALGGPASAAEGRILGWVTGSPAAASAPTAPLAPLPKPSVAYAAPCHTPVCVPPYANLREVPRYRWGYFGAGQPRVSTIYHRNYYNDFQQWSFGR